MLSAFLMHQQFIQAADLRQRCPSLTTSWQLLITPNPLPWQGCWPLQWGFSTSGVHALRTGVAGQTPPPVLECLSLRLQPRAWSADCPVMAELYQQFAVAVLILEIGQSLHVPWLLSTVGIKQRADARCMCRGQIKPPCMRTLWVDRTLLLLLLCHRVCLRRDFGYGTAAVSQSARQNMAQIS